MSGPYKAAVRHHSTQHIMQFFHSGDHLPEGPLRDMFVAFSIFAQQVVDHAPDGPELTVSLRKLLEAKDAAVRALLDGDVGHETPE